jgi:hypothetical protein
MEDFKYYVLVDLFQATHNEQTTEVSKSKLLYVYEGMSLKILLWFGKGMNDPTKHITVVFDLVTNSLDELYILKLFPDKHPVQQLTWCCSQVPLISNYSIKANLKKPEHIFTKILQLPGKKCIKLLARMHKNFWIDE